MSEYPCPLQVDLKRFEKRLAPRKRPFMMKLTNLNPFLNSFWAFFLH